MPSIVCLGEALIDMVSQAPGDLAHAPGFAKAPGGAPANVAAGLGILGAQVGFIGKVGKDPWGDCLDEALRDCNVDTSRLVRSDEEFTRLAFAWYTEDGKHGFMFHGKRAADEFLSPNDLLPEYIAECDILHFGSITTINDPARTATYRAVDAAAESGSVISYDPNWRPSLWPDEKTALDEMARAAEMADVIKVNKVELEFLSGQKDIAEGAGVLYDLGPELVAVTLGPEGCYYHHANGTGAVPGHPVEVVDTVGCGDAFVAGMLLKILECERDLGDLTAEDLQGICAFANAAAAITATGQGAIPALPSREEVEELLSGKCLGEGDAGF